MDNTGLAKIAGYALVALGVILYVAFGLARGAPMDVGVYSVTIVPIVAGLGLIWRAGEPAPDDR